MFKKPVYLDYQATTPVDPQVFEKMRPYFTDDFGNSGSRTHEYGEIAKNAIEEARKDIADFINVDELKELIFTSGATESNNIALQGIADHLKSLGKTHIITSAIEHKSILDILTQLEEIGFSVTYLNPAPDGTLTLASLERSIRPNTGLITLMHANNEIGVINPIEKVGEIAEERGIIFHCDASQSLGKIPVDIQKMKVSMLSMSAHKLYGPKGVGALYINRSQPNIRIKPLFYGGGQEQGMRSGTLSTALIVGLTEALRLAVNNMQQEGKRISELRDHLLHELTSKCQNIVVNGTMEDRLPNNLNISILGVPSEILMINLRGKIAISNGSACTSYAPMYSYVLQAMGIGKERIETAIRLGLGRFTTLEEIDYAIDCIATVSNSLRKKLTGTIC